MTPESARGISGDRRRNPFPGWTEAEYQLFLATIRGEAAAGVKAALAEDCVRACPRMEAVEATVFGRAEKGIVGMDERLRELERFAARITRLTWLVIGALVVSVIGLLFAVGQFLAASMHGAS